VPTTPNFISGRLGTISINSNFFNAEQYDIEEATTLDDITYTQVGGATFKILLPQYNWVTGTITFVYDANNQPTIAPFDMRAGTLMALILYPEGTKPYSFNAYSGNFRWASGPKAGTCRCTTRYESTGTVTFPTS
jgi:hypothetical protein